MLPDVDGSAFSSGVQRDNTDNEEENVSSIVGVSRAGEPETGKHLPH